jgi:hypothetical protein
MTETGALTDWQMQSAKRDTCETRPGGDCGRHPGALVTVQPSGGHCKPGTSGLQGQELRCSGAKKLHRLLVSSQVCSLL